MTGTPEGGIVRSAHGAADDEPARSDRPLEGYPTPRHRHGTMAVRIALAVGVLVVVFGFALPRIADYGEAWRTVRGLSPTGIALLTAAGLVNLVTYWLLLVVTLPGLRWREAAVVNQASTAVANTVPAGGVVALAVTYRTLHAWGFTTQAIANQIFVTGVWNALVKFGLPVIALAAVASTGELEGSFVWHAGWGLAALVVAVACGALVLWVEAITRTLGHALDGAARWSLRRVGRERGTGIESWLVRVRLQLIALISRSGIGISAAAVVSHLSLYLVLLTALRVTGIGGAEVSWAKTFAAFALVRLLSAIPVTPGGVGVVELGYVGFLATGAAHGLESRITAAVLLFRAITYLLPIGLGAVAWLAFQSASSWRRPANSRGTTPAATGP